MLDTIFQSAYIARETVIKLIDFNISILLASCGHASHRLFLCLKECHLMVLVNLLYLRGWGPWLVLMFFSSFIIVIKRGDGIISFLLSYSYERLWRTLAPTNRHLFYTPPTLWELTSMKNTRHAHIDTTRVPAFSLIIVIHWLTSFMMMRLRKTWPVSSIQSIMREIFS
jgi:hypothetical protein